MKYEEIAAKGGDTPLTLDDMLSIFGIIGTILSYHNLDSNFRNEKLKQAVT